MTMAAVFLEPENHYEHATILETEVVKALVVEGGVYLDVTVGGAGHARAILEASPDTRILGFDRDLEAVRVARERLRDFGPRASVAHVAFDEVGAWLERQHVTRVDGLIADLGVSSQQLGDASRGMSFRIDGPLDMRMDRTRGETAAELIERLSQDELANLIYQLGEERRSRRVARCIKQALEIGELDTSCDLRRAVVRAVGPRRVGGIDPATRTFQALRMAVNRELEQLDALLTLARERVRAGGVVAFISFHSLEDRRIKRALLDADVWARLTKKPIVPSAAEQARNPRSRSAKLRVARRIDLLAPAGAGDAPAP